MNCRLHSEFTLVKQIAGFGADDLVRTCKIIFSKYGISSKLISDAGTNFTSEKFQGFHKCLNIHHTVS